MADDSPETPTDDAVEPDQPTDTTEAETDAAAAKRKVERRVVTSRRVTPKAGAKVDPPSASSKARDAKKTEAVVTRTPPVAQQAYSKGPSPWWVPALMFVLLIAGGLLIMANYMGVFGDPDNIRLVLGLGLILGGIITATQYR